MKSRNDERTFPAWPVMLLVASAMYLIVSYSYWFSANREAPSTLPAAAKANPEFEVGPLWEDGEVLTDAKTGEKVVWKKEKK